MFLLRKKKNGKFFGHANNYLYIQIENVDTDIRNQIVAVKINEMRGERLIGSGVF